MKLYYIYIILEVYSRMKEKLNITCDVGLGKPVKVLKRFAFTSQYMLGVYLMPDVWSFCTTFVRLSCEASCVYILTSSYIYSSIYRGILIFETILYNSI